MQRYALLLIKLGTLVNQRNRSNPPLTLLDRTELFSKVLVCRCSGHLFKSRFPAGEMFEPLINLLG